VINLLDFYGVGDVLPRRDGGELEIVERLSKKIFLGAILSSIGGKREFIVKFDKEGKNIYGVNNFGADVDLRKALHGKTPLSGQNNETFSDKNRIAV